MSTVTRRDFLKTMALGAAACTLGLARPAAAQAAARKPNFVIIFIDDMGYGDIEPFGQKVIKTPNLNRMAAEGRKFTDFYSANPVCSPSRAALMTGCYPTRVTVPRVLFPDDKCGLNPKETTIAEVLKGQGYATACFGKWHLGHKPEFLPTRQGFDSYLGIPYSNDMKLDPLAPVAKDAQLHGWTPEKIKASLFDKGGVVPLYKNEELIEYPIDQDTLTGLYTKEAIKFIEANKEKPFFLYLPHSMVHVPLAASAGFRGKSPRGLYGDAVEEVDWSVGQILETLRKSGLAENTFVLFTSDNGPWLIMKENGGSAGPLRDGKGTTYEGGMREPTLMWWPGTIPAGTVCQEVAGTIDMLPTLTRLAGAGAPQDRVIDGHDIAPLIKGAPGAKSEKDTTGYYYYNGTNLQAVRLGKWKLRHAGQNPVELYNLETDIGEQTNLAEKEPAVVAKLTGMMQKFDEERKAHQRPAGVEGGGEALEIPRLTQPGKAKAKAKGQGKAKKAGAQKKGAKKQGAAKAGA